MARETTGSMDIEQVKGDGYLCIFSFVLSR